VILGPEIAEEYQSQIQLSNVDITDPQNNETIVTIQSLSEKVPVLVFHLLQNLFLKANMNL